MLCAVPSLRSPGLIDKMDATRTHCAHMRSRAERTADRSV